MGGIILLLESGGAFAGELSYLISSCETVQTSARFLEKEGDCGSTDSQSKKRERRRNRNNSHIRHRAHTRPRLRITIRQVMSLRKKIPRRKTTTILPIIPLTEILKGLRGNQVGTLSFSPQSFVLFFLLFSCSFLLVTSLIPSFISIVFLP